MPTRLLDKAELCSAVQQAVGSLSDRQRMAVLLAKFEHMSYVDIGAVMDMSPQAVKSLLSRARTNLRESLQPYLDRGAPISGITSDLTHDSHAAAEESTALVSHSLIDSPVPDLHFEFQGPILANR